MNTSMLLEKRLSFRNGLTLGLIIGSLVSWANKFLLAFVVEQMAR